MCGVSVIFSKHKVDRLNLRISNMIEEMKERGPNASGTITISNNVALGHTRLSIIDLNCMSNQPMVSNSGRYYIVFNGEIVNYLDIGAKLSYKFKTKSDTEVILASIEEKGIEWFLDNAIGMFAICIYDTIEKSILLVRDKMGIKPLYYTLIDNEILVVASEIKAILSSGLVDSILNEEAIDEYLANRYIREPFTFFKNIYQIEASTYIVFDKYLNKIEKKYYDLPKLNFQKKYDENEIIEATENELKKTIDRWIISDVNIGTYLSGGVDSSLLSAMVALKKSNLDTYTIGFNDEKTNEFKYAKKVSNIYKTNHREILIEFDEYIKDWDRLIYFKGAPLGVPNEIALAKMTSKLSKDVTVVISGEGADEVFGGYGRIYRSAFEYSKEKRTETFYEYFKNLYEYVPNTFRRKYLKSNKQNMKEYFDLKIGNEFDNYKNEENIFRYFLNYHIKGLLQRLDTCTMQTSIESRPPFLDGKLIDFACKEIPYDLKLKWNDEKSKEQAKTISVDQYSEYLDTPKYILKKVSEKYLPNEIIYRKKMGFPIPLQDNIEIMQVLSKEKLLNSKWLKIDSYDIFKNDLLKLSNSGQVLWMLINVEKFIEIYFNKSWRY
ncbi:MAG: asparagine synthase (glutamine-hydrolyzing) [Clostridium sp.]|nr:asparagine synthase (glutamine-hydrolyzing) [Clostridium sp.]